jgi:AcrR family transcriptional regulator
MTGQRRRVEQVASTRDAILAAAERLFGEHGIHAVSNRQISEAAGQGNNAVVNYHFGTKADVLRALVERHSENLDAIRSRMIADITDPSDLRQWVSCAVMSVTEYMDSLGTPSWYARLIAQIGADPAYRALDPSDLSDVAPPSLQTLREGLSKCLPDLPDEVRAQRSAMTRHLISQVMLERERVAAGDSGVVIAEANLIDAVVALWEAPAHRNAEISQSGGVPS